MASRITIVVSQGQSKNPAKRSLEEEIVAALLMEHGFEVTVIPHLYDLNPDSTGMLALSGIGGDMIVLSWLFPRAAHWTLNRNNILGQLGQTLLVDEEEEDLEEELQAEEDDKERVIDQLPTPSRKIYCIDLRVENKPQPYIDEIKRIAAETSTQVVSLTDWVTGSPQPQQMERFLKPTNDTALGNKAAGASVGPPSPAPAADSQNSNSLDGGRRWYPVIDFSRCTNCMECIDFCLFGVYGVDQSETILVEQPDNCRKGCPACSRVCPENAIMFPQHKTPAIAGALVELSGLKIDLSQLFGAPEEGKSAEELAAAERDEQLVLAGREAAQAQKVDSAVSESKGPESKPVAVLASESSEEEHPEENDELDDLIDALDDMDL